MSSSGHSVTVDKVTQRFADYTAVMDVSLSIEAGELVALLGPSGCGKSTLLRIIAGFIRQTEGRILFDNDPVDHLPANQRGVGIVFQNYALFPHMTVRQNIAYGLEARKWKKPEIANRVEDMLARVHMQSFGDRFPTQLSGGQQQRIALARAIVNRPALLLLDEPLGALDLKLRRAMQIELKWIQTEVGITFVHVTHDQEEAMTMADTIAVMNEGKIEQMGSPADLYDNPRTSFVANFLGQSNLIKGSIVDSSGGSAVVDIFGTKVGLAQDRNHAHDSSVLLGIRPEKIRIQPAGTAMHGNILEGGVISDASYIGVSTQYQVEMPWGQELMVFEQNDDGTPPLAKGDAVVMSWEPIFTFGLAGDQDATAGSEANPDSE